MIFLAPRSFISRDLPCTHQGPKKKSLPSQFDAWCGCEGSLLTWKCEQSLSTEMFSLYRKKQLLIFSSPFSSSSSSFLSASSENPFSRGILLTQRPLAAFPLPRACWTKLNPVVNNVGKENDINLRKSVIKRWLDDFSCFQRNADLSLWLNKRKLGSQQLPTFLPELTKCSLCQVTAS